MEEKLQTQGSINALVTLYTHRTTSNELKTLIEAKLKELVTKL